MVRESWSTYLIYAYYSITIFFMILGIKQVYTLRINNILPKIVLIIYINLLVWILLVITYFSISLYYYKISIE